FIQNLLDYESERVRIAVDIVFELERIIDTRQLARVFKFHVHHGTDDLNDFSFIHNCGQAPTAIWAVAISSSSVVMLAWRILLYSRVRSLMNCFALSVAFFIATMRALCSEARASSIIWKT